MALYTDYFFSVPWRTSFVITNSDIANAIADAYVAYVGCTLVRYATAGAPSSGSNYAEISWNGLRVRIWSGATSACNTGMYIWYDDGASYVTAASWNFHQTTGATAYMGVRLVNMPYGFLTFMYTGSGYGMGLFGAQCTRIKDSGAFYCLGYFPLISSYFAIEDTLNLNYAYPSSGNRGAYDMDGMAQVLNPLLVGTSTTGSSKRYKVLGFYTSDSYLQTGYITINGKSYYADGYLIYEIQT